MPFLRASFGLLTQVVVTAVVLAAIGGAAIYLQPSLGRSLLNSGLVPDPLRPVVVAIAPEAGAPAPEVIAGTPRGGRGGPQAPIVVAGTVGQDMTRTRMKAIGTGEAQQSVTVYPDNTSGIVEEVVVSSGDAVAPGEVLVRLESENQQIAVERARIALEAAERNIERYRRLQNSSAFSGVDAENAAREGEVALLDLREAELSLSKREIRSPIAGRVGIVTVDRGDLISAETAIATVDDREKLKVVFFTPESFVGEISVGTPIEATPTAHPSNVYEGEISAIDSRLDQASRTLRTEALIENTEDRLRPGMSFTVDAVLPGERHLAVDPLAVVWQRDGPIVWKIVDGEARAAAVRIVSRGIDQMLIASNELEVGDPIVVEGLQSVRDGGPVTVQNNVGPPADDRSDEAEPVAGDGGPDGVTPWSATNIDRTAWKSGGRSAGGTVRREGAAVQGPVSPNSGIRG